MKIWVDADAAPNEVKQIVFRAANRLQIETILVANRHMETPSGLTTVRSVHVRDGANEADRYIVAGSQPGDLAITADLPLAGELVEKNVYVVDPRGQQYSEANIASRLSMRDFMDVMRGGGLISGGAAPYGDADKKAFASTFDRLLTKAMRLAKRRTEQSD